MSEKVTVDIIPTVIEPRLVLYSSTAVPLWLVWMAGWGGLLAPSSISSKYPLSQIYHYPVR